MFRNCSECDKPVNLQTVKYFTADHQNVFCDAHCSVSWFSKQKAKEEENDDR